MGEKDSTKEKCPEEDLWPDTNKNYGWGIRHVQMACMCVCITSLFVVRGSMAVAVLAMNDQSRRNDSLVEIYDWDKRTQGVVLSSFFWGYMAMQIPAGMLAKRFGGKLILLVSLLANGVLCAVLPTLASLGGWRLVCAARVAMGLTQACLFPASHTLLGQWLPAHERTALAGVVYGGSMLGTIISMPVAGVLADTARGWQVIFYAMAVLMLTVAGLWHALSASTPAIHRLISPAELAYINLHLNNTSKGGGRLRTPWRHILRSGPLWAVVMAHFGMCGAFVLFFVDMPTYLEKGLGISLKSSALLSALPYAGMWVGSVASSILCEKVYNRGLLSMPVCRKICNSIALYGTAVGLLVLSFLGRDHQTLAIVTLVVTLTLKGFCSAGFMVNHLDLSPNYAGVLLSLTNFLANSSSVVIPILTGLILRSDPTDVSRWRVVFLTIGAIAVITNTYYVVFARFDIQPWDDPDFVDDRDNADPEEMKPVLNLEKEKEANKHSDDEKKARES